MHYFIQFLKSLFFNFFAVFFSVHVLSGIDVIQPTKLPHVGGELIFAFGLGLLNALIFPILRISDRHLSPSRIALSSILLNFSAYALLKFLPVGVEVSTIEGYIFGSLMVSLGSFLTNFVEMKHFQHHRVARHEHKHDNELGPQ